MNSPETRVIIVRVHVCRSVETVAHINTPFFGLSLAFRLCAAMQLEVLLSAYCISSQVRGMNRYPQSWQLVHPANASKLRPFLGQAMQPIIRYNE